jgi:predicted glycosyltransferase
MRRIALYSHDAQGLGHMHRNIAIGRVLAAAHPSSILLIAGAREAGLFRLPPGTDTLALLGP